MEREWSAQWKLLGACLAHARHVHAWHVCSSCDALTFSVNNNMVTIEMLTGSNFKMWKRDVELAMELAEIDVAMMTPKPIDLTPDSTNVEKVLYSTWYKMNRMCYLTIKRSISEHLLSGLPDTNIAKELLTAVSQQYQVSINIEIGTLLRQLYSMKYNGIRGVKEYILTMVHIQNKLRNLGIVLPDACIFHQALNTLPSEFGTLITIYNLREDPWTVNAFITICVAEEKKLKAKQTSNGFLMSNPQWKDKRKGKKAKTYAPPTVQSRDKESGRFGAVDNAKSVVKKEFKCFFCKKKGHKKADCLKYKTWSEKRGLTGVHKQEEVK